MRAERGKLRSGGDGGSDGMSIAGLAAGGRNRGLVLWHRPTRSPMAPPRSTFSLPDFNGSVRVSAVAWSASKIGSAAKELIVRDPVTITASAPRFLTLGDRARLELAVHNVEGVAGSYRIAASRKPPARARRRSVLSAPLRWPPASASARSSSSSLQRSGSSNWPCASPAQMALTCVAVSALTSRCRPATSNA